MSNEQIYITVDGSENGKKWIDTSKNINRASNIADLLQYILEEMSIEEQESLRVYLIDKYQKKAPYLLGKIF